MIGACGISERGPDPAEALGDELLARQLLLRLVPLAPGALVQVLRERLCETVGERLDHDRLVVVVFGLVPCGELVCPVDRDREGAQVVAVRRDVVGETPVRPRVAVRRLLPQETEARAVPDGDVVSFLLRRPEAVHAARLQLDSLQQRERVVVELARRRLVEDRRELPLQLPRVEEELPIDIGTQRLDVHLELAHAREQRHRQVAERDALPVLAGLRDRQQRLALLLLVL